MTQSCKRDIVIDVGANQGGFAIEVAARNAEISVLAIEPIPQLCAEIAATAKTRQLENIILLQLAADATARSAKLHVSDHADCGVSSLLKLDDELIKHDDYWQTREDLYFDHTIDVAVVRLDSIPEIQQAERIRFIKIDAQGVDLPVLESLGDYLPRVEAGVLEVPSTHESRLYTEEVHDLHSVTSRLLFLGFRVYAIKPNDNASKEFNLFFCRQDIDWRTVEHDLQLRGVVLYDGKHFWHSPADRLAPDAALADMQRIIERLAVVEPAIARETMETKRLNERLAIVDPALTREIEETKRLKERLAAIEPALAQATGEINRLNEVLATRASATTIPGTTLDAINRPALDSKFLRPSAFNLKSMLTSGARILWAGRMPPLARLEVDTRLLNPENDFRMPPEAHQAYDLVYLVENDLGKIKAWPVVVDESLRLLRPGGVLVIRMTNTPMCSIFALKHLIHQWGGLEPLFEFTCEDGATEFAVRNSRTAARPLASTGISFGIITDGKRRDRLSAFIQSVYALERANGQQVEVLVCGPNTIKADLAAMFPQVHFVVDTGDFAEQGWITRKKNQLVDSARYDTLVIAHDRYTIDAGFLLALQQFGSDFSVAVCRQVRPDGRRFPDWVSLGAQWSWSSPAMLEYGDWTPHMFINGGIIIGKTEVLRMVRWNELLFWNQAEDVELTRRLMSQGFIPRLVRKAVAVSHLTRPGTMEACEPLPVVSDRYYLSGPAQATAEVMSPSLPFAQPIRFRRRMGQMLGRLGIFRCERWHLTDDAIELPYGVYGEIGGRLPSTLSVPLVITLSLAAPAEQVEVIVNDLPITPQMLGPLSLRLTVPAGYFANTRTFRLHMRVMSGTLRLQSLLMAPFGWTPGMPLPVTRESVFALGQRPITNELLDGGALCVSDLPLLTRGARRIAVFVPETLSTWTAVAPFITALRTHVRREAIIRCVGKSWRDNMLGVVGAFDYLVVDWQRYGTDRNYLNERDAAFNAFKPDLIVNTEIPRAPLPDYMIYKSHALGVIGFESAIDEPNQEYLVSKYTRLLPDTENASDALCQALAIPTAISTGQTCKTETSGRNSGSRKTNQLNLNP